MTKSDQRLPKNATPLGLDLLFPVSVLGNLEQGYQSQNQDEKWSVYFQDPWFEVWRPSRRTGSFCYAIRLEQVNKEHLRVVESWVSEHILEGLGPDLNTHRKILTWLFDNIAGYARGQFQTEWVSGFRTSDEVSFGGKLTSLAEVEQVAAVLRSQIAEWNRERAIQKP